MKKQIGGFLVLLLATVLLQVGCSNKMSNEQSKPSKSEKRYVQVLTKPNQEAVALLSAKYDIAVDKVETFFDCYLSDTSVSYRLLKAAASGKQTNESISDGVFLEKGKYYEALAKASNTIGIPVKIGSLLVFDYKFFMSHEHDSD